MKWEYMVDTLPISGVNTKQEIERLNEFGAKEWELVHILEWEENHFDYYFKRQIETNKELRKIQLKGESNGSGPSKTTEKVPG